MREALKLSVALGFFFYVYKIIYLKRSSPIKMLAWAWPNSEHGHGGSSVQGRKAHFLVRSSRRLTQYTVVCCCKAVG